MSARVLREKRDKRTTARLPAVQCPRRVEGGFQDAQLETVASALYLGCKVTGGRRTGSEVVHRTQLGNVALHKHWNFSGNKQTSLKQKLAAYRMYITSVVLHGHEGWHLGEKELKVLNGFDLRAQMLMTGWEHDVVLAKRVFVLVDYVRARRLNFLGHTLRLERTNLTFQVLSGYHSHLVNLSSATNSLTGTIFDDAPCNRDFGGLVAAAKDREGWNSWIRDLAPATRRASGRLNERRESRRGRARASLGEADGES